MCWLSHPLNQSLTSASHTRRSSFCSPASKPTSFPSTTTPSTTSTSTKTWTPFRPSQMIYQRAKQSLTSHHRPRIKFQSLSTALRVGHRLRLIMICSSSSTYNSSISSNSNSSNSSSSFNSKPNASSSSHYLSSSSCLLLICSSFLLLFSR